MTAANRASPRPSGQLLAGRILAATASIVNEALHGDWRRASAAAARRRALVASLDRIELDLEVTVVNALREAITESDAALAVMNPRQIAARSRTC